MILIFVIILTVFWNSSALIHKLDVKIVNFAVEIVTDGYFFKEFEIIGDSDNISFNCSSSVMIYFRVVTCDNKSLAVTAFLSHYGDLTRDSPAVNDCRRTNL